MVNQYIRYEITAVDNTDWESVKSDFVATGSIFNEKFTSTCLPMNIPKSFALNQNYPNPFNPSTEIKYSIPNDAHVKLIVYDILG